MITIYTTFLISLQQFGMSVSKIRQCHITCRVESIDAVHGITAYPRFISPKGKCYNVHNVTAAYNVHTKEARIYAEFDRVSEKVIEDNMEKMGAGSIIIDSFSSGGWENAAETAFRSVVECGGSAGFTLIRHGNEPRAANHTAGGGSGSGASTGGLGGRASSDEEEEEQRPRNDERHKRQRTASPDGGGRGMEYFEAAMDKMASTVASAVSSSGSAMSSAIANAEQRREKLERQLREMQLKEERRRIEEEVAARYKGELNDLKAKVACVDKTIGDLKKEHAAAIKAKDEEALTARKLLVDELDAMRLAKVVIYFIPCVCIY